MNEQVWRELTSFVAIALVLGIISEALAWRLSLWLYNRPWVRIFNVLITFGLIYGGLSHALAAHGFGVQFLVGAPGAGERGGQ